MAVDVDRHLLFGMIALQVGLIDQSQLVVAFQSWVRDKSRSMADHLAARGVLDSNGRNAVDVMVDLHIKKHGDTQRSLAVFTPSGIMRAELESIADPETQASMTCLAVDRADDDDPFATRPMSVGVSTSSGVRFKVLRPLNKGGMGVVSVLAHRPPHSCPARDTYIQSESQSRVLEHV